MRAPRHDRVLVPDGKTGEQTDALPQVAFDQGEGIAHPQHETGVHDVLRRRPQ